MVRQGLRGIAQHYHTKDFHELSHSIIEEWDDSNRPRRHLSGVDQNYSCQFICTYVLCHTVSVNSHEIHAPSLGSGASVGGGEVEVASRRSGSGSDYDQWKLSVKSENHTPSPASGETSVLETTPKPDEPRPRL